MSNKQTLTLQERIRALVKIMRPHIQPDDIQNLKAIFTKVGEAHAAEFGLSPVDLAVDTSLVLCEKVSPDRTMVLATMVEHLAAANLIDKENVKRTFDEDTALTVERLIKATSLYERHVTVESENFRRLLLAFAEDIRVIIIMIARRLALMKAINHHPDQDRVRHVAYEAGYLYAPLAHRLGLYAIKSELEDLSLKYTDRAVFTSIAHKLNETKVKRDAYIKNFIEPIKKRLEAEGLKFDIKGRTKSIYSIWNKMKKQRNDLDHIYDLFAIRIIIDAPIEREKPECWLAYSIVTDMYRPNPARMKDWISLPKSNGYESLHITVYGPDDRWVEVQIRTRRMDEIAEKGLAAHWRYKGVKAEQNLDSWMRNVRDILETAETGPMDLMKNLKMDIYSKEVFVFTPKGDLYRLPLGASVLDFAFHIHTGIGSKCTGAIVNGRNVRINQKLASGDTVEILTSATQTPKRDWLNYVVTSKARNKIRITLKEQESHAADLGKELLQRRFKNRKIEVEESVLMRLIKKMGYKTATEFFACLGENTIDVNDVMNAYTEMIKAAETAETQAQNATADEFVLRPDEETAAGADDVLEIGSGDGVVKGLNYKLARCCNPIYGDKVFGFISAEGVVKIHREDCPNAQNIKTRYPYRIIRTRWTGKFGAQTAATLRIVGRDQLGIVTNITSIISKEKNASLRNISIDSQGVFFQGFLIVGVSSADVLTSLIKKIRTVKGVREVTRAD